MSDEDEEASKPFAAIMFAHFEAEGDYRWALVDFKKTLAAAGLSDFEKIRGDDYDTSIELDGVGNDVRLTPQQQKIIFDAGFVKIYVNHQDGWQTHYTSTYPERPCPVRGWRRRYVTDPAASTTNQIGADDPEHRGYYEISYWPEGWNSPGTKTWLSSGYMRIVPDPLEPTAITGGKGSET